MSNIPIGTKCPGCGSQAVIQPAIAEASDEAQLVCAACGHAGPALDFVDKDQVLAEAAKLAQDAFGDIPAFRKK